MDGGTLYQLRNLINRRNVVSDPSDDVNACEDFLELIVIAHILCAIMAVLGMETLDDNPSSVFFPEGEVREKTAVLQSAAKVVINDYTDFTYPARKQPTSHKDHIHEYAKEVLTLGLFFLDYKDAIREGDGTRVLRSWKYLLLFFRATGHKNYTIEAFTLLAQHYYFFPPRLSQQLLWSRFVNTQGKKGHNIPADLHMEHLNRICKDAVSHLGANKTPNAIVRARKAISGIGKVLQQFDTSLSINDTSGYHPRRDMSGDLKKVVSEIHKSQVFSYLPGRKHRSFQQINCNVFRSIDEKKFETWMKQKFAKQLKSSILNR